MGRWAREGMMGQWAREPMGQRAEGRWARDSSEARREPPSFFRAGRSRRSVSLSRLRGDVTSSRTRGNRLSLCRALTSREPSPAEEEMWDA